MTRDLSRKMLLILPLTVLAAVYLSPIVQHYSLTAAEICKTMWLHYWFYLLPIPLVIGLVRLISTVVKSKMTVKALPLIEPAGCKGQPSSWQSATAPAIFHSAAVTAFTAGFFRPRVYLSDALVKSLSPEELEAVITHERAHAERKDPLWSLLATFGRDALFPVPIVHWLYRHHRLVTEYHCDTAACDRVGDRLTVASTILKVQKLSAGTPGLSPAFSGILCATVEKRIKRLLGQEPGAGMWIAPAASGVASLFIVSVLTSLALYGHESLACLVTTL